MAYNRQPQSVLAGTALVQNPPSNIVQPAGIIPVTLDCEIATAGQLGVVQVGSGLSITQQGVLSVLPHQNCSLQVHLTSRDYTATEGDCYIGVTEHREQELDLLEPVNNLAVVVPEHSVQVTLPRGVLGKLYVVKNQGIGIVRVTTTNNQLIDITETKTLAAQDKIMVIFNGTKWNTI